MFFFAIGASPDIITLDAKRTHFSVHSHHLPIIRDRSEATVQIVKRSLNIRQINCAETKRYSP